MNRYAKAPKYAYDSGLRSELLAQSARRFEVEIRRGMDWLEAAAAAFPRVRKVLDER
jgi:hypothetical protein